MTDRPATVVTNPNQAYLNEPPRHLKAIADMLRPGSEIEANPNVSYQLTFGSIPCFRIQLSLSPEQKARILGHENHEAWQQFVNDLQWKLGEAMGHFGIKPNIVTGDGTSGAHLFERRMIEIMGKPYDTFAARSGKDKAHVDASIQIAQEDFIGSDGKVTVLVAPKEGVEREQVPAAKARFIAELRDTVQALGSLAPAR